MPTLLKVTVGCVCLGGWLVGFAIAGEDRPQTPEESLLDDLQGVWVLESLESAGTKVSGDDLPVRFRGMTKSIKGERLTVRRVDGKTFECTLKLTAAKPAHQLDIVQAGDRARTAQCLVKLVDGKLVVAEGRSSRPKTFETAGGQRTIVSTYVRQRPAD